jgi:hypothetical protein
MKKAKEFAKEIVETYIIKDQDEALALAAQTVKDLFKESIDIRDTRRATNYGPMLAILKEQHLKWISICRHVNKDILLLNERAFLDVIEEKMTMTYPHLIRII